MWGWSFSEVATSVPKACFSSLYVWEVFKEEICAIGYGP